MIFILYIIMYGYENSIRLEKINEVINYFETNRTSIVGIRYISENNRIYDFNITETNTIDYLINNFYERIS